MRGFPAPAAHPRSRGENRAGSTRNRYLRGSSPLTRGKRRVLIFVRSNTRLIPAHAGKTRSRICSESTPAAHPRSRGENRRRLPARRATLGSSPLTRGKLTPTLPDPLDRGLIPAHAGKTVGAGLRIVLDRAHPRSRGENLNGGLEVLKGDGSSPLTRGKPVASSREAASRGLIPAHAGKTC